MNRATVVFREGIALVKNIFFQAGCSGLDMSYFSPQGACNEPLAGNGLLLAMILRTLQRLCLQRAQK